MKTKILIASCFLLTFILFSCKTEREKRIDEINAQSREIIIHALDALNAQSREFVIGDFDVSNDISLDPDSIREVYANISLDSAELGLVYANQINFMVSELLDKRKIKKDSIEKARQELNDKAALIEQKKWENSKPGRIQKKHPDWSNEDCELLANRKIWIGMTLDMVKYLRGNPNNANPSNYGNGNQWQWCWDDYTPSCFYGGDDGIITSYN